VALALGCGCVVPTAESLDSTAVDISQIVAHESGEFILCMRGGYAAILKLLWWHWVDKTYCLIFWLYISAKFEFGVFLLRDAMLLWYIPSLCVYLCGVDVVF